MAEDEKTQRAKLRLALEPWREIILPLKDILVWKKPWHPTAIIGANTVIVTLLWLLDPSVLTVIAILGLVLTFIDYLVPSLLASNLIFKDDWTAVKDEEFEELCTDMVVLKNKIELYWSCYSKLKATNKKMHFIVTVSTLCFLAWFGNVLNNLLLFYIVTTSLLLLPGMERNGIINKWMRLFSTAGGDLLTQAKSKVTTKKAQ